ncbi:MAG: signal peptidase [Patescibacteria group bacterium]|nr:signal peptidase [Patescibacteria group bacterium]
MNPEISNQKPPQKENFVKEIIKFTLIALAIVIPIRAYVAQPFIVSGASMDPTFSTGQYLIVDQLSYRFEDPQRGEIIIFKYPNDIETFFIKRIIGLPAETISVDNGKITIINTENPDGFVLDESYITKDHKTSDTFTITLGHNEYFVMGDNRPQSSDSRAWGPLEEKYIVGRPFVRLLPLSKISVFPGR